MIGNGLDEFVDRPLDAVKMIVLNFDELVKAAVIPAHARTISPSLPRFLLAIAALGGVLLGATLLLRWRAGPAGSPPPTGPDVTTPPTAASYSAPPPQ
jgi:hypothetical protein